MLTGWRKMWFLVVSSEHSVVRTNHQNSNMIFEQCYFFKRGQAGRPHPQDPENPRKRCYKVFKCIEDTRSDEISVGMGIHGSSEVGDNKAERQAIADHMNAKMAVAASVGLEGLWPSGGSQKRTPKAKVPKTLTQEEQEKKGFDRDLEQNLVSHVFSVSIYVCGILVDTKSTVQLPHHLGYLLRIGKLATKARDTATKLTETGIGDQEAGR